MGRSSNTRRQRRLENRKVVADANLKAAYLKRDNAREALDLVEEEHKVATSGLFAALMEPDSPVSEQITRFADITASALAHVGKVAFTRGDNASILVAHEHLEEVRASFSLSLDASQGPGLERLVAERSAEGLDPKTFRRIAINTITKLIVQAQPSLHPTTFGLRASNVDRTMRLLDDDPSAAPLMAAPSANSATGSVLANMTMRRRSVEPDVTIPGDEDQAPVDLKTYGIMADIAGILKGAIPIDASTIGCRTAFSGLAKSWSDTDLMGLGLDLWRDSYRQLPPIEAERVVSHYFTALYEAANPMKQRTAVAFAQFAALWAHEAYQKIVTSHTYGAALMCTDADEASLGDLKCPWNAFMVVIPDGLLSIDFDGDPIRYGRVLVSQASDGQASMILYDPGQAGIRDGNVLVIKDTSLSKLLSDNNTLLEDEGSVRVGTSFYRALMMAKRLVIGLMMAVLFTDNHKTKSSRHGASSSHRAPGQQPDHRMTVVGEPIKIDCRAKVAEYLANKPRGGKSKAPSVQVLVRGFYREQVWGPRNSLRRRQWIQPFWRGRLDAPIFTKPKLVES